MLTDTKLITRVHIHSIWIFIWKFFRGLQDIVVNPPRITRETDADNSLRPMYLRVVLPCYVVPVPWRIEFLTLRTSLVCKMERNVE